MYIPVGILRPVLVPRQLQFVDRAAAALDCRPLLFLLSGWYFPSVKKKVLISFAECDGSWKEKVLHKVQGRDGYFPFRGAGHHNRAPWRVFRKRHFTFQSNGGNSASPTYLQSGISFLIVRDIVQRFLIIARRNFLSNRGFTLASRNTIASEGSHEVRPLRLTPSQTCPEGKLDAPNNRVPSRSLPSDGEDASRVP